MRMPEFLCNWLFRRALSVMKSRPADFLIGEEDEPYLRRWHVLPRNRWFNVYVHCIHRDDPDRGLHDHPYANVSLVLAGVYRETLEIDYVGDPYVSIDREAGDIVCRLPSTPHRLTLKSSRAVTIFVTGPRVREWGFWTPEGWKPWHECVDPQNPGMTKGSTRT